MRTAAAALAGGLGRVRRSWGLCVLLLAVNLATALILAVPLARTLAADFHERPAGRSMMRGFDYPWWSQWSDTRSGWQTTLGPDLLGAGFTAKNLDLLLKGQLPAAVFAVRDPEGRRVLLDPLLLGIGAAYMLVQLFFAGGVLGVLRQAQGRWTVRGMLHGSGFYCGRFLRVWVLMMLLAAILFAAYGPLARWTDGQAREAVSEAAAEAWLLGRHAVLLLALVFLHVVGTYARVITVLEERSSAVLALALWQVFDQAWTTIGYRTQLVTLLVMQAVVLARIALRVALAGALMDLYRRHTAGDPGT